ncbi:hypothetical protein [Pseudomonas sp. PICF6]|jgi:hypothetical protein|uniref:hypothetical protein n=1 Tax=Pseudomonas sp. PICF6 TaxID=2664172 RepID=UPI00136F2199|nr:hypothetical protein [Pseudomonas sp. PICF6]MXR32878.1 hypothetical protein [Pseudomonas sp. PICF6]
MHRIDALRTAMAHAAPRQNQSAQLEETAQTKAKAPKYGALRIISRFFVTSHLKLARPLQ